LANRIILGIIAAAFVIGLAVFAAGFGFASALGVYVAWTIVRSGPR
jgi:hypothetical protein